MLTAAVTITACTSIEWPRGGDAPALSAGPSSSAIDADGSLSLQADSASVRSMDEIIADDLIDILVQLRAPVTTTVQVGPHDEVVGETVVRALIDRGFGIQRVDADQGPNLLAWQRVPASGSGSDGSIEMRIGIGSVNVTRAYRLSATGNLQPDSAYQLYGTRQIVRIDDSNFDGLSDEAAEHTRLQIVASHSVLETLPTISLITDDIIKGVARSAAQSARSSALNSSRMEVRNLYYSSAEAGYSGDSAFTNIRDDHVRVRGEVVIFADDSLRLGPEGKQQVVDFLENFQPQQDIIGLIGCSNGPTRLDIGNEGLALGRSRRIAEELQSLGVPRESILDEGCWSGQSAGERFPSRGVVMELLRRPVG